MSRRSLTPTAARIPGDLPQRRVGGGARREATDRVGLALGPGAGGENVTVEGWALNVSRGGLRALVDGSSVEGATGEETMAALLALGRTVEVRLGEQPRRPARIVWIQEEPDGAILGVAFTDVQGEAEPRMPGRDSIPDTDEPAGSVVQAGSVDPSSGGAPTK